jgi:UDP-galactopyranose mutase
MILIVGCGLSGAVCAERLATFNKKVLIIDKLDHIGGLCYDYIDTNTGILLNKYGAHLFHTNSDVVWNYVNNFCDWERWDHKVVASVDDKLVPIPINITTINQLCNNHKSSIDREDLLFATDKIIKPYTFKQWGRPMEEMNEVLKRIKTRNDYETRYFTDKYQALPKLGYTYFFKQLLKNPLIEVRLNTPFESIDINRFSTIIFTGPIDKYFGESTLEYRSVRFEFNIIKNTNFYQPNSVVNYPSLQYPFTRIIEYKHFLNQKSNDTIIALEYPDENGTPMYPVPIEENIKKYEYYKELTKNIPNTYFIGRLANYKYFNMDEAILNAINLSSDLINI